MLYMQSLAESTNSVEEASNAIAWAHAMGNCHSPTESQFVRSVLQGLQRLSQTSYQKASSNNRDVRRHCGQCQEVRVVG